jgi:hypothetical protein
MKQPMPQQILEMLISQPEEPGGGNSAIMTESSSAANQSSRGSAEEAARQISWTGKNPTGIVGVAISNLSGSKETAMGWINSIVPKITK